MAEEIKKVEEKEKRSAQGATLCLAVAMLIMALWGWTPLKEIIPAIQVLGAFLLSVVLSISFAILTTWQGLQLKHLKARLEDK